MEEKISIECMSVYVLVNLDGKKKRSLSSPDDCLIDCMVGPLKAKKKSLNMFQ